MSPYWIAGNAVAVVSSLVLMSYIRYERRLQPTHGFPWLSVGIIGLTAAITAMQFQWPDILALLRRDPDGLRSGELWRLITPTFVQPGGMSHAFAVMGGLAVYVLRHRRAALKPFVMLAAVPIVAAAALAAFRDGHGPSLLLGALVASRLPAVSWPTPEPASSATHPTTP